jgi:hypothetical protein
LKQHTPYGGKTVAAISSYTQTTIQTVLLQYLYSPEPNMAHQSPQEQATEEQAFYSLHFPDGLAL